MKLRIQNWPLLINVILVVTILCTLVLLGYVIAKPETGDNFTEFYILGLDGKAEGYPTELKAGDEVQVIVGITNQEHETVSYRVEVRINGVKNSEYGPLVLSHGEKREEIMSFYPGVVGDSQKVEFLLYENGQSEPHLEPLQLWVNVME